MIISKWFESIFGWIGGASPCPPPSLHTATTTNKWLHFENYPVPCEIINSKFLQYKFSKQPQSKCCVYWWYKQYDLLGYKLYLGKNSSPGKICVLNCYFFSYVSLTYDPACPSVVCLIVRSVCYNFLKRQGSYTYNAPSEALVNHQTNILSNKTNGRFEPRLK